ncbi:uncharacterized protein [Pyxicephalus adspersus]
MKFLLVLLFLIPIITTSDEHKSESHEDTKDRNGLKKAQALRETVKANTEFAINFFKHVTSVSSQSKDSHAENVVVSPISISSAFSMLSLGAQTKTHQEIWEGLRLNNTHCKEKDVHRAYSSLFQALNEPKSGLQVNIGNAVFVLDTLTLLKSFQDDVQHHYHAEVRKTNFINSQEAKKEINEYVKNKTEGKIEELFEELSAEANTGKLIDTLALLKALKMMYEYKPRSNRVIRPSSKNKVTPKPGFPKFRMFSVSLTRKSNFTVNKNTTVSAPTMHREGLYKAYKDGEKECIVMEVPYTYSTVLLLIVPELDNLYFVCRSVNKYRKGHSEPYTLDCQIFAGAVNIGHPVSGIFWKLCAKTRQDSYIFTMRWTFVFILLFGLCLAHQPTKGKSKKNKHQEKVQEPSLYLLNVTEEISGLDISNMNSNFGFSLYRMMAAEHDNNIFFSPFSVSFLLGALTLGTRGNTHEQLLSGLGWEALQKNPDLLHRLLKDLKEGIMKSDGYSLDLGSISLIHESFNINQEFLNQTKLYFDMEFKSIDFQDRHVIETIRDLIREKTRGRISELQDEIDPQTKMMLLDFIFFKGKWQTPFKTESTNTDTFYVNKYSSVKVPMMYKTEKVASMFDKSLSSTVLSLPYRGGAHMLIVMPENEGNFDALEDSLSGELVASWLNKMKTRKTDVFFPKFQLDHKYKMKSSLEELGIKDIFTGKANLTGMTEERNLKLSEVSTTLLLDIFKLRFVFQL